MVLQICWCLQMVLILQLEQRRLESDEPFQPGLHHLTNGNERAATIVREIEKQCLGIKDTSDTLFSWEFGRVELWLSVLN